MASVFKRTYLRPIPSGAELVMKNGVQYAKYRDSKDRLVTAEVHEDGKRVIRSSLVYSIAYVDANGDRQTERGFRDKQASEQKGRELEKEAERIRSGLPVVRADKLQGPIREAIDAYVAELRRLGRSASHLANEQGYLYRLEKGCGWKTLASIRRDGLTDYVNKLAEGGRSPRTQNAYRDCAVAFCNWCVREGRLRESPIGKPPKATFGARRPRQRRAFTVDEFSSLTPVHPVRGLLYRVAGLSGLRRSELCRLQRQDFRLGDEPQWRLRAEITKGKRYEVVPMLPECAELMVDLAEGKGPADNIFASVPLHRRFKADLKKAGITRRDDRERQVDFHSLRCFFCTLTGRTLPIQLVKLLMRHRDIRTTCNLYLDLGLDDVNDGVKTLPRLLAPSGATTEGKAP